MESDDDPRRVNLCGARPSGRTLQHYFSPAVRGSAMRVVFRDAAGRGCGKVARLPATGEQQNRAYLYDQNRIDQENHVIILNKPPSFYYPRGLFTQDNLIFSLSLSSDSFPANAWAKAMTVGISPLESQYSAWSTLILISRRLGSSLPLGK